MERTRTGIAVLAIAATALAAGCGGGQKTLTKAQVISQGGAICKAAEKRLQAVPQPTTEHPFAAGTSQATRQRARQWLASYASLLDSTRAGLQKLAAPAEGKQLLDGYLRDIGTVVTELRAASKAPADQAEGQAMRAFQLFEKASKQTAAYGFPKGVCGAGDSQ